MISDILAANNLKLNIDKTKLVYITSRQQLVANGPENLKLSATNSKGECIKPSLTAKILEVTFQNNLNWLYHFERGGEAVLSKCKKKLGALQFVTKNSTIKVKK